jgi:outer membrane receptor protein involved in Fe transport
MRLRVLLLFSAFMLTHPENPILAQVPTIAGKVIEESTGEAMEFVSVVLFSPKDSQHIRTIVTDKSGAFEFENILPGPYYIQTHLLGFESNTLSPLEVHNGKTLRLRPIKIKSSPHLLQDVVIKGEKDLMESSIDRKVYNVGKDVMSGSGSASEILDKIPSISVDIEGVVSLRGSANVTILVDGRPSALMRSNSAMALQQIPANTIERIEVITNPSVKYKPDGTAGIVNIVLKKEKKPGWNGTLQANAGNNDRLNGTLGLNYKPGALNFFGSYGYRQDNRGRTAVDIRTLYDENKTVSSLQDYDSYSDFLPKSHRGNLGIDYAINDYNSFNVSGSYSDFRFLRTEDAVTKIKDPSNQIIQEFNRIQIQNEIEWEKELRSGFLHKFKKEDHELKFDISLSDRFEKEDHHFTESYKIPALEDQFEKAINKERETSGEFAMEYSNPLTDDKRLEAGYELSWTNENYDVAREDLDASNNVWIPNLGKSNTFDFKQQVHAGYITFSNSWDAIGVQLGMRAEQVNINSYLVTLDSTVKQDYFKWYPGIHISYELNARESIKLSYSKRINRPDGDELNPFPDYDDPRNIHAGNPSLKPEQIHSIELGYHYKNDILTFVPSLYYRYTYDKFTSIKTYINDSTLLTTEENISSDQSAGLELIVSIPFKKLATLNLSGNLYYKEIDGSNLGYTTSRSDISSDFKLNTNINLTNSTILQLDANIRSGSLTPQGRFLSRYYVNAGLRQNVFGDKGSILLTVSDVFNSMRWEYETDTPEFFQASTRKRVSQVVYLGFSYRFGSSGKKSQDELRFEDN